MAPPSLIQSFERALGKRLARADADLVCQELASLRDGFGAPYTDRDRAGLVGDAVSLFAARVHELPAQHALGLIRFFVRQQHEIASLDPLAAGLGHADPAVRTVLAELLAGTAGGRSILLAHLLHDDEGVRALCAEALARHRDPTLLAELRELRALETSARVLRALDAMLAPSDPPRAVAPPASELPVLPPLPPAPPGTERARIEGLAAAATPCERIYLVHEVDEPSGWVPRPGSLSCIGGSTFALVVDLAEVPELAARFPGARALGLRVPEPELGQRNDEARLEPRGERAARAARAAGSAIALTPLEVPEDVFTSEPPREHAALWTAVARARGHVLGRPRWIHGRVGDDGPLPAEREPGFVLQLDDHDGRAPVNLGQGALYVSEDAVAFQCT